MPAPMVAGRTGAERAELAALRRVLGRRHWDVAAEARDVRHAVDRFRSLSTEHVPYLPPHAARGLALADRLDDLAHRVERTHDALGAADRWLGRTARRAFDAESARQAGVTAWRTAPGSWARAQRWAYDTPGVTRVPDAAVRQRWDASWRAARGYSDGARWSQVRADIADDVARLRTGVSSSRIGAVGRLGSKAVGAGGVVLGGWDLAQGLREGDTERAVTGGLSAVASGAMLIPFPPVQAAGAIVTAGVLVYSYRDEIASAGRAVVDAARRDVERKVDFARDVAGAAGDLAGSAGDLVDGAWNAVGGLF